ncbi:hypothetical protein R3W88_018730 [Solanum pinnatisectum]|uniref:F-box domain-containing protein n=1 Tax=Solanum pinnatisectum TaxID=50273 RepID=A0AAV9KH95_9SOLN|nr:hypothetical protein R3W88_018730 [Solanum pinnatisectum]
MTKKKLSRLQNILPNEIIEIILSNLPFKFLLRFKCVSEQWHCLFSSPNFKFSTMSNSQLSMQRQRWSFRPSFTLINQQLTMEELDCSFLMKRRDFSKRDTNNFMILGSCHGLILINVDEHIYLWNPAIRCCTKVLELYYFAWEDQFITLGGLCFDSSENDYKAVMFTYNYLGGVEFVTIASLKDKEWRLLKFSYDIRSIRDGITLHGRLHYRVI